MFKRHGEIDLGFKEWVSVEDSSAPKRGGLGITSKSEPFHDEQVTLYGGSHLSLAVTSNSIIPLYG
jgi:hypothetical protein